MKRSRAADLSIPKYRDISGRSLKGSFEMLKLSEIETIVTVDNKPAYQDFCTECSERVEICQCWIHN